MNEFCDNSLSSLVCLGFNCLSWKKKLNKPLISIVATTNAATTNDDSEMN